MHRHPVQELPRRKVPDLGAIIVVGLMSDEIMSLVAALGAMGIEPGAPGA